MARVVETVGEGDAGRARNGGHEVFEQPFVVHVVIARDGLEQSRDSGLGRAERWPRAVEADRGEQLDGVAHTEVLQKDQNVPRGMQEGWVPRVDSRSVGEGGEKRGPQSRGAVGAQTRFSPRAIETIR